MAEPPAKRRKESTEDEDSEDETLKNSADQNRLSLDSLREPIRHTHNDLVTLLVGPEQTKLVAVGHLLTQNSEFFQTALKKEWEEGQTRVIKMPMEDATLVTQYLDFAYAAKLRSHCIEEPYDFEPDAGEYENLCELYLFGERVLDVNARNAIVTELIRLVDLLDAECHLPGNACIDTIYAGTPAGHPARRLMVDLQVYYRRADYSKDLDQEYLADVVNEFTQRARDGGRLYCLHHETLNADEYFV